MKKEPQRRRTLGLFKDKGNKRGGSGTGTPKGTRSSTSQNAHIGTRTPCGFYGVDHILNGVNKKAVTKSPLLRGRSLVDRSFGRVVGTFKENSQWESLRISSPAHNFSDPKCYEV